MKMEIKTSSNTRQLPLETLKTFVQLFMQQVIREHKNPLWEGTPSDHRKNFFNGDQKNPRSYTLDNTVWNGTDANGMQ